MKLTISSFNNRLTVAVFVVGSMLGFVMHLAEAQKGDPPRAQAADQLDVDRIISQFTSGETELLEEFGRYG